MLPQWTRCWHLDHTNWTARRLTLKLHSLVEHIQRFAFINAFILCSSHGSRFHAPALISGLIFSLSLSLFLLFGRCWCLLLHHHLPPLLPLLHGFPLPQMVTRTKKIFVGGLSAPSTVDDVKGYFEQFGRVRLDSHYFFFLYFSTLCVWSSPFISSPTPPLSSDQMSTRPWGPSSILLLNSASY